MGLHKRNGVENWWYRFMLRGKLYRGTTGTADKRVAEKIARDEHAKILLGLRGLSDGNGQIFSDVAKMHRRKLENEETGGYLKSVRHQLDFWTEIFVTFHTLRHTVISRLHWACIPIGPVAMLVGHSVRGTILRSYTHIQLNELRDAVTVLERQWQVLHNEDSRGDAMVTNLVTSDCNA